MYNSGNSSKNVTGASIVDGTVETVDIADDAVTADKLANTVNTDIATGVSGSTTAGDALPKAGGTMTGTIAGFTSTGIDDNATSTAITINSSENVGIGVVPETWQSGLDALQLGLGGSIAANKTNPSRTYVNANIYQNASSVASYINTDEASQYFQNAGTHIFNVAPSGTADTTITWTTAMTIENDGDVLIGTTNSTPPTVSTGGGLALNVNSGGHQFMASSDANVCGQFNRNTSDGSLFLFRRSASVVGSISVTASATSYNTSSDYRLKEDDQPMVGSIDRLKSLRPINFAWKVDGSRTDGFLAHEAGEVVPECATGTKDAMMDEEYEVTPAVMDGETVVTEAVMGTRTVPDYQGIDQSKLVPLLVSALQEAITRIEQLENI